MGAVAQGATLTDRRQNFLGSPEGRVKVTWVGVDSLIDAWGGRISVHAPEARESETCTLKVAAAAGSRGQVMVRLPPLEVTVGLAVKLDPVSPMKYSTPFGVPSPSKSPSAACPPA